MENGYLEVIPGTIPTKILHQLLLGSVAPRPIAFASTISRTGIPNLSPFSFFNVFGSNPAILAFSPARRVRNNTTKDTLTNVYEVPEVVVNVVPFALIDQVNLASAEYESEVDEFEKAGFTKLRSDLIKPWRVAESPVQMECEVVEIKPMAAWGGAGNLIICKVLKMHIAKHVLNPEGLIDPHKIDLAGRMSENFWARASGNSVFKVEKALLTPAAGVDQLPASVRASRVLTGSDIARFGNVEAFPIKSDVESFRNSFSPPAGIDPENLNHIHQLAKTWLEAGEKEKALMLLLAFS